jgi:hypothetical protein
VPAAAAMSTANEADDPISLRFAAQEDEILSLRREIVKLKRLAHRARLDRYDTEPDTKDSADLHRAEGHDVRYASRFDVPSGASRFDPAAVFAGPPGAGGDPAGARRAPQPDFITVRVDGEEYEHHVPLPAEWQRDNFRIAAFKEYLVDALGVHSHPTSTSLLVHLGPGIDFQATSSLTLPQSFICNGRHVTLKKKPSPAATPQALSAPSSGSHPASV